MRVISIALLGFTAFSSAEAARFASPKIPSEPAQPIIASLPALPDACAGQETLSGNGLRFITLFGAIDWEGRATQVQVQEPSDNCLKEAAVEAVRQWTFEPVDPDTKEYWRLNFETTLVYPADGEPRFKMTANDAILRYPPSYPEKCMSKARSVEIIATTFDVTTEGALENIETVTSTLPCLTKAAEKSVKKWRYTPRVINGRAYPRTGVYNETTFYLGEIRRQQITNALMSVSLMLGRKLDPQITLEKIAHIEKRFENKLRDNERATLLRYRGAAKISALDYNGALEDFQASLKLETHKPTKKSIADVISQLEKALASTNTATPDNPPTRVTD